jgi:hypothetical protein
VHSGSTVNSTSKGADIGRLNTARPASLSAYVLLDGHHCDIGDKKNSTEGYDAALRFSGERRLVRRFAQRVSHRTAM